VSRLLYFSNNYVIIVTNNTHLLLTDEMDEPAFKRQRNSLPARPSSATSASFKPRVTNIVGAVGTKEAFVLKKPSASPYVDLSMVSTHLVCILYIYSLYIYILFNTDYKNLVF
jgi:hypothetical protein